MDNLQFILCWKRTSKIRIFQLLVLGPRKNNNIAMANEQVPADKNMNAENILLAVNQINSTLSTSISVNTEKRGR